MVISAEAKQGGEVFNGKAIETKAVELLEEFGLPRGLLPLRECEECGIVRDTGFLWIISRSSVEHYFEQVGRKVCFGKEISARLGPQGSGSMSSIKGVKAKEFMLWVDVSEIQRLEPDKIRFRAALAGITRTFPAKAFD